MFYFHEILVDSKLVMLHGDNGNLNFSNLVYNFDISIYITVSRQAGRNRELKKKQKLKLNLLG